jgi:hypothetical protein
VTLRHHNNTKRTKTKSEGVSQQSAEEITQARMECSGRTARGVRLQLGQRYLCTRPMRRCPSLWPLLLLLLSRCGVDAHQTV